MLIYSAKNWEWLNLGLIKTRLFSLKKKKRKKLRINLKQESGIQSCLKNEKKIDQFF